MDWLRSTDFAHRGLHGLSDQCPENSLSAIEQAISHGYGIELDIMGSSDGDAIAFHDLSLKRMTGRQGLVARTKSHELKRIRFRGMTETIPTLRQVLDCVNGQVPLLLELKTGPGILGVLEMRVSGLLRRYTGEVAVMSWTLPTVEILSKLLPDVPCGTVLSRLKRKQAESYLGKLRQVITSPLRLSGGQRFEACRLDGLLAQDALKARDESKPLLTWTIKSSEEAQIAREVADAIIFEGFTP